MKLGPTFEDPCCYNCKHCMHIYEPGEQDCHVCDLTKGPDGGYICLDLGIPEECDDWEGKA